MTKFDMNAAWNDAMQLLRGDTALTSAIVGVLILLPTLAFALIGPVPVEPPPNADLAQMIAAMRGELTRLAPILVPLAFLSSVAAVAVMRLWLAPAGTSVSDALAYSAALIPPLLVVFLIQSLALSFALLAFVLPAIYLAGRWAPAFGLLASGDTRNPMAALSMSWAMTKGNGWRIALMLVLVQVVITILSLLIDGIGGIFGARPSAGYAVASLISAGFGAAAALVSFAVSAAIYRQLAQTNVARTFE